MNYKYDPPHACISFAFEKHNYPFFKRIPLCGFENGLFFLFHIAQFISVSAFLFHFRGRLRKEQVCECAPLLSSELVTVYVSSSQMTMWLEILLKQTFNQIQSLMRPSLILSHFLSKASLRLSPTLAEERLSAGLPYQQRQMGLLIVDRHADSWSHFFFIFFFLSKITENALRI